MKRLTPKNFLTVIALSLVFLTAASAKPALAFDFNVGRAIADNMDNWLQNVIVGLINRTAVTAVLGCPLDEISNSANVNDKIKTCVGGSGLNSFGQQAVGVPPSLLGLAATAAFDAPQRSDIYPVNLAVYLNSLKKDSLIFPTEAYAAGTTGDNLLGSVVLGIWTVTRNLAYVLFVLMLVVFGFMVMFRYKINPQTVITVQEALPRVVVNLLLITFSYPIGVLAINLIGTLTGFAIGGSGIFPVGGIPSLIGVAIGNFVTVLVASAIPGGALFMAIIVIGAAVALLLTIIALLVSLLTRYARIMLMVIAAPLQFAFATIPGNEGLVSGWFKSLIGNVVAIPAMVLVAFVGIQIMFNSGAVTFNTNTDPVMKTIGLLLANLIGYAIGLWFIWNARNAPKWIEGAMGIGGGWSPGMAPKPGKK